MKSEKHESDRPIKQMKRRAAEWTEYNLAVPPFKKEKMSSELDSGISSKTELHLEHNHDSDEFAKQKVNNVKKQSDLTRVQGRWSPHTLRVWTTPWYQAARVSTLVVPVPGSVLTRHNILMHFRIGYEGAIIKHPSPVTVRPTKGGPSTQLPFQMVQDKILVRTGTNSKSIILCLGSRRVPDIRHTGRGRASASCFSGIPNGPWVGSTSQTWICQGKILSRCIVTFPSRQIQNRNTDRAMLNNNSSNKHRRAAIMSQSCRRFRLYRF